MSSVKASIENCWGDELLKVTIYYLPLTAMINSQQFPVNRHQHGKQAGSLVTCNI